MVLTFLVYTVIYLIMWMVERALNLHHLVQVNHVWWMVFSVTLMWAVVQVVWIYMRSCRRSLIRWMLGWRDE
jgi:hypothetical protein